VGLLFDFFGRLTLAAAANPWKRCVMMAERHDHLPLLEVDAFTPLLFAESPLLAENPDNPFQRMSLVE
jgi:hypothetical protein